MNVYKNNKDSAFKPAYIKFLIMQNMFTHNPFAVITEE